MTKRIAMRNKMLLGFLTLGDLRNIIRIEGEFCLGQNWIPIGKTKSNKGNLRIFMPDSCNPDMIVPLDSIVKIEGRLLRVDVERSNISCSDRDIEVKILLDEEPFPETTLVER